MQRLWDCSFKLTRYGLKETSKWIPFFKKHGVVILANTPCDTKDENLDFYQNLAATLNTKIYESLFGRILDSAGYFGTPTNDIGFNKGFLPPHTDLNYDQNGASYLLLTGLIQAEKGGESIIVDGKACAENLKSHHPDLYDFLSNKVYSYSSSQGSNKAKNRIIVLENDAIHHNNYDMDPVKDEAYHMWNMITLDPEFRVETMLTPGETMILNNHRVLHGRNSFVGERNLKGCYFV